MKIGIIGGGSWGTAIAQLLANNDHKVCICSRNQEIVSSINNLHINKQYFPDIELSPLISSSTDIHDLYDAEFIFVVIPTQTLRSFFAENPVPCNIPLVLCSKGIEMETALLPSQVIKEISGNETLILSGPNFAKEIIRGLPAAATLAFDDLKIGQKCMQILHQKIFLVSSSTDKRGVEICAAAKNVIAIASGICEGKNLGENSKAAIITSGISEIKTLIKAMGGIEETICSLAGIGDIFLTASSPLSRNMSFGIKLAKGEVSDEKTVEGYYSAKVLYKLAKKLDIEMPICESIYDILYDHGDVDKIIANFFNKKMKKHMVV